MPQPGTPDPGAQREAAQPAVLVGVDGSPASRTAIAAAAREASYRSAPLIAMQAYDGEEMERGRDRQCAAESGLREAVRDVLGAERAARVQVLAVLGLAGGKIVETALQVNAQLIVLAAHGSRSMLLGTVSQYVLRRAPCPVLVIPAQPAAEPAGA